MPEQQLQYPDGTDPISDEAIAWLVRLKSGKDVDTTTRACEAWLQQSAAHRTAFEEAKNLWEDLGMLPDSPAVPTGSHPSSRWRSGMSPSAMRAVAAILVLCVFAMSLPSLVKTMQANLADYQTGLGEQTVFQLADGSTIHLNTDTAINITMTPTDRRVTLVQGEANFVVAPDAGRPFTVATDTAVSQALGTEFTVRRMENGTVVTVLDHAVAVSQSNASGSSRPEHILHAGQRVRISADHGIGSVEAVNLTMAKAWQHGRLIFDEQPLGQVIAELNRYRSGAILMMNPQLDALQVTGVFDLTDTQGVLKTIQETLPISSLTVTPYLTVFF